MGSLSSSPLRALLVSASRGQILRRALQISAVVGVILNIITQGQAVSRGTPIAWGHVVMNSAVPFCVATYGAARHERGRVQSRASGHTANPDRDVGGTAGDA